ncbi:MAG: hypothetical protein J6R64_02085 [Lentisphaeria bacterium]|nr:hypothetical protein [Lentisphaeria bacterium]
MATMNGVYGEKKAVKTFAKPHNRVVSVSQKPLFFRPRIAIPAYSMLTISSIYMVFNPFFQKNKNFFMNYFLFAAAVRDNARHGAVGAAVPPLCCLHAPETGQTARSRFRLLLRRGRRILNASHAFHAFTTPAPRPGQKPGIFYSNERKLYERK